VPEETLVLCLGNSIRRDDGVGWRVAESLLVDAPPPGAVVRMTALSGLYLLDEMEGFDRVVVVDAVATGRHLPGTVLSFPLEAVHAAPGPAPHGLGLPSAIEVARRMGAPVPSRVDVVAIEVADMHAIGFGLSPAVAAAVPAAVARVREALAGLAAP
jgi:hydrogenase maturation protease